MLEIDVRNAKQGWCCITHLEVSTTVRKFNGFDRRVYVHKVGVDGRTINHLKVSVERPRVKGISKE